MSYSKQTLEDADALAARVVTLGQLNAFLAWIMQALVAGDVTVEAAARATTAARAARKRALIAANAQQPCAPKVKHSDTRGGASLAGVLGPLHGDIGFKVRHRAGQKPYLEVRTGSDWNHDRQKMVHRHQLVDRDANVYYKRVVDEQTGEVIRYTSHPLDQHIDHGADNKNPRKPGT